MIQQDNYSMSTVNSTQVTVSQMPNQPYFSAVPQANDVIFYPQPVYYNAEIQMYSSMERGYRAKLAAINAESRARKEEEDRNTTANDCQIVEHNGQLCAFTKGKCLKPVLSHIPKVYRINPESRYRDVAYYLLFFPDLKQCCRIPVPDLNRPGKLEAALAEQAPDVQLFVFRNERKLVLEGLRGHLCHGVRSYDYPYFFGWQDNSGSFQFSLLEGTTHGSPLPCSPEQIKEPELFQQKSPAESIIAVQQVAALFQSIKDENIRQFLFIWWHISFLYSFLDAHGHTPSVGLCIVCPNPQIYHAMENLFQWYSDPAISLATETPLFQAQLPERKDQPLLVSCLSPNARNEAILLNLLRNHHMTTSNSCASFPQQATLTLLLKDRECLIRDPSLLCVAFSTGDITSIQDFSRSHVLWHDYFRGFVPFVSNNMTELCTILDSAKYSAVPDSDGILSYQGEEFLQLYSGIRKFLRRFLTSLDSSQSAVANAMALLAEDDHYLITLIEHSSSSKCFDCEQFLWAAQKVLETGAIALVDVLRPVSLESKEIPTVFYDRDYCYFRVHSARKKALKSLHFPTKYAIITARE